MFMTINIQEIRALLSLAGEFGLKRLKLNGFECEFNSPVPPPSEHQVIEEIPVELPSADEMLFGHTGMLPEAMTND